MKPSQTDRQVGVADHERTTAEQPAAVRAVFRITRTVWRAPLWAHVLLLTAVLVCIAARIGTHSTFTSDEANIILQGQAIEHGHWTLPDPFPAVDHGSLAPPILNGTLTPGGLAPLSKHLFYGALIAGLLWLFGPAGVMGLSILAGVLAALCSAWLARIYAPGLERAVFWLTGLASPLFLYSLVDTGQAVGAAAAAGATLAFVLYLRQGRRFHLVGAAAAISVAVLAREEATLWCVAMGLAGVVLVWPSRWETIPTRRALTASGTVLAAGLGVRLVAVEVTRRLLSYMVAANGSAPAITGNPGLGLNQLHGTAIALLGPGSGDDPFSYDSPSIFFLALATLFILVLFAFLLRRQQERPATLALTALVVAAMILLRLEAAPTAPITGLLVAFPVLWLGLWLLSRRVVTEATSRWIWATVILFTGGTAVTIYPNGGGWQWGGRYLLLAVPVAVPFVVSALRDRVAHLPGPTRTVLVGCLVVASLTAGLQMATVLNRAHHSEAAMALALERAAPLTHPGDGGLPVVVSASIPVGTMWSSYFDYRALAPTATQLPVVGRRLRAAGIQQFLMVSASPGYDNLFISRTYQVERVLPVPSVLRGWAFEVMDQR